MMKTLNVEMRPLKELSIGFDNLSSGQSVGKASVLFPKLIDEDKDKKGKGCSYQRWEEERQQRWWKKEKDSI